MRILFINPPHNLNFLSYTESAPAQSGALPEHQPTPQDLIPTNGVRYARFVSKKETDSCRFAVPGPVCWRRRGAHLPGWHDCVDCLLAAECRRESGALEKT